MAELVSILIPAYNAERWIRDCLVSALSQTWRRKEVIVVDDGSSDRTVEVARMFESEHVRILMQANRGASAARNLALSVAQGDYIQWLDADDVLLPGKIAAQMAEAGPGARCRTLFSGEWAEFYRYPGAAVSMQNSLWEDLLPTEWLYRKTARNAWMAIETWLVSRWLTEAVGPWNENLHRDNDGEYFNRVVAKADQIRFVAGARALQRKGVLGISSFRTLNDRKLESLLFAALAQIDLLRALEDSPRTRAACLSLLSRTSTYFYPERPDLLDQLDRVSRSLGGVLLRPALGWKCRFVEMVVGPNAAKRVRVGKTRLYTRYSRVREWMRTRRPVDPRGKP